MQRGSFFKSLATLLVAPKILAQIDWTKAIAKSKPPTTTLFKDLRMVTPEYYSKMVEKYGDKNYGDIVKEIGESHKVTSRYCHYWDSQTGKILQSEEPISATITL